MTEEATEAEIIKASALVAFFLANF